MSACVRFLTFSSLVFFLVIPEAFARVTRSTVHHKPTPHYVRPRPVAPATMSLWPATQSWDWGWETKYAAWVQANLTPDFFQRAKIPTVCSDVIYILRWIFARENGLPMANHFNSGRLFSSSAVPAAWAKLPTDPEWDKDERFMAAIRLITTNTDVYTLWRDSYPIAINKDSLLPGAYHVNQDKTVGHAMMVWQVNYDPSLIPVITLSSTTPRAIRLLNQYMYVETKPDPDHLALLRMRWPLANGRELQAAQDMPFYSVEQFGPEFVQAPRQTFWQEIFYRINPQVDFVTVTHNLLEQLSRMFVDRQDIVDQGFHACLGKPCVDGTQAWEDWSTPSRDARIRADINVFDQLYYQIGKPASFAPLFAEKVVDRDSITYTLDQVMQKWRDGTYSSDPNDVILKRWGASPEL